MASSKRLNSGLSTSSPVPTSRWPRLSANVGETRATSDRWTRETGPPLLLLLILLLLSASPSHGTREDPLERDRQRHSYTFGSLKVDDPRRHCFFFTLLRSRSDARKRDSELNRQSDNSTPGNFQPHASWRNGLKLDKVFVRGEIYRVVHLIRAKREERDDVFFFFSERHGIHAAKHNGRVQASFGAVVSFLVPFHWFILPSEISVR